MKIAAIDIGTNTFLCLIAEVQHGHIQKILSDEVEIVRIGEGVSKTKRFSSQALVRASDCLERFSKSINSFGASRVLAVATSAARDVLNGQELLDIGERLSIPIEIISGLREAQLTYSGVRSNPSFDDKTVVIDVGGGSTEIIFQEDKINGVSFDVGGVRLTEKFIHNHPTTKREIEDIREYARQVFGKIHVPIGNYAVAVAGTPTTIAALEQKIEYTRDSIEGSTLSIEMIDDWIEKLAAMSLEERSKLPGLEPKRADIIIAGAVTLSEGLKAMGLAQLKVSTRGVRYGVASELGK